MKEMRTSRGLRAPFGLLIMGASLWTGCGFGCAAIVLPALEVVVIDAVTSQPICNAMVTARDGNFNETLTMQGDATRCSYTGAAERPGTYVVSASSTGYMTATRQNIQATSDVCGVQTTMVTIALSH